MAAMHVCSGSTGIASLGTSSSDEIFPQLQQETDAALTLLSLSLCPIPCSILPGHVAVIGSMPNLTNHHPNRPAGFTGRWCLVLHC
jgi:hypothetical protein